MTCEESVFKDLVQRVLDAGKALGRIVVLVMDMDVVVLDSFLDIVRKHALIHVRLCGLRCEFHHHSGRSVGVHVRVFSRDLSGLCIDDFLEDLT